MTSLSKRRGIAGVKLDIRIIQCVGCLVTSFELGRMDGCDEWLVICTGCGRISTLPDEDGLANVLAAGTTKLTP